MARRLVSRILAMRGGADPVSRIVPGRPMLTIDVEAGGSLPPSVPAGAIVRLRVRVEPGKAGDWEETSAWRTALMERLRPAAHVYPPEVDARDVAAEAGERRVLSARDPEAALREYVTGLGIPEGDAALVLEEGLDVLHECEIA